MIIDLVETHRDALGVVMAVGRGDIEGAMALARPHLDDPVRAAALVGSIGGVAWRLAAQLARREGVDPVRALQEISLSLGRRDG